MFEGVPNYPDAAASGRFATSTKCNICYTAPTAIRALMREGDEPVKTDIAQSLRLLGTVGEPINPEAWEWYLPRGRRGRCPIVDTWWQTETGDILITPLPGATDMKPGSPASRFFGVQPALVDARGQSTGRRCEGQLIIKDSWPGQMRTCMATMSVSETYFSHVSRLLFHRRRLPARC